MQPAVEGTVPEFEEREAAKFNGYTWKQWTEDFDLLDPYGRYNRAAGIAWYRMSRLLEHHVDDAVNIAVERKHRG